MSQLEIPLLRESAAFARRLLAATASHESGRYHFHRRVNWSYRFGARFYKLEAQHFQERPDDYLAGELASEPLVEDVYAVRLGGSQVATVTIKAVAHWTFRILGAVIRSPAGGGNATTYRKAYVDDIELVFDPEERGVLRAVYPFPINVRRQLRYLAFIRKKGYAFRLTGLPYGLADLARFLLRRDVRSLQRLESRAQLRHASELASSGFRSVQLSDEFEIGSLDFVRRILRHRVSVRNSAHGVGKYFPVHAYPEFQVVTRRQAEYYRAVGNCRYEQRRLNDRQAGSGSQAGTAAPEPGTATRLVFLSQSFAGVSEIIVRNEHRILGRLARELGAIAGIELHYRPHPNCHQPAAPEGFSLLPSLDQVNGKPGTLFVSFFSTCQIDPAFKGRKVLLRGELIYPEIAFDSEEEILGEEGLVALLAGGQSVSAGGAPARAAAAIGSQP